MHRKRMDGLGSFRTSRFALQFTRGRDDGHCHPTALQCKSMPDETLAANIMLWLSVASLVTTSRACAPARWPLVCVCFSQRGPWRLPVLCVSKPETHNGRLDDKVFVHQPAVVCISPRPGARPDLHSTMFVLSRGQLVAMQVRQQPRQYASSVHGPLHAERRDKDLKLEPSSSSPSSLPPSPSDR